jgi:hypothetical protein
MISVVAMAFHVTHLYGAVDSEPPLSTFPDLLRDLDDCPEDIKHEGA